VKWIKRDLSKNKIVFQVLDHYIMLFDSSLVSRPNIQIMGALLKGSAISGNPYNVLRILEETRKREVTADEKFVLTLEKYKEEFQNAIIAQV